MTANTEEGDHSWKGSRGWAKEGLLTEGKDERVLRLKNGAQIEADWGNANYFALQGLLEQEPEAFHSLLEVARGGLRAIPEGHLSVLRNALLLRPDGTVTPGTRDVLLSAYRETPDGPALVNPFQFTSEEEVRREEQAEKNELDRVRRWLREGDKPGSGGPSGRR